ncbi:hypothetical protein PQX77_002963 [Marasmius sp. AFHP31]|nr:hypothetical protein PQX77_002963 [Marasmius sp. AFHP31]
MPHPTNCQCLPCFSLRKASPVSDVDPLQAWFAEHYPMLFNTTPDADVPVDEHQNHNSNSDLVGGEAGTEEDIATIEVNPYKRKRSNSDDEEEGPEIPAKRIRVADAPEPEVIDLTGDDEEVSIANEVIDLTGDDEVIDLTGDSDDNNNNNNDTLESV